MKPSRGSPNISPPPRMARPRFSTQRLLWQGAHAGSGFAAGFLATLFFHQALVAVLNLIGLTDRTSFVMDPTPPLGVPVVVSLGLWGGFWGIALVYAASLRGTLNVWLFAAIFGATGPTFGNWFISAPLHGRPLGNGWHGADMLTSILVNTAWGLGTALLLRCFFRQQLHFSR